jgi:hypothetical protein
MTQAMQLIALSAAAINLGGTVSGPVVENKLFFFYGYQGHPGTRARRHLLAFLQDVRFRRSGNRPNNVQQWNVSFQNQLGANWLVSASYLGSKTTHQMTWAKLVHQLLLLRVRLSQETYRFPKYTTHLNYGLSQNGVGYMRLHER